MSLGLSNPQALPALQIYPSIPAHEAVHVQIPVAQPVAQPAPNQQGSYAGRAVKWLNETASGRLLKTIGFGIVSAAAAVAAVSALIKAVVLIVFGIAACTTGFGLPVGLVSIGLGLAFGVVTAASLKVSQLAFNAAKENYDEMRKLSALGR